MSWILILFAHTSVFSKNDSNSLTTAMFYTEQSCIAAGKASETMAEGTTKVIKYKCVTNR
jgi:hypothetical protein